MRVVSWLGKRKIVVRELVMRHLPPPPLAPALTIVFENIRFRSSTCKWKAGVLKKSPFWSVDPPTLMVWAVNSRSHDLATKSFYCQKSNKTVYHDKNNLLFWFYLTHILEISRIEVPIFRFLRAFFQTFQIHLHSLGAGRSGRAFLKRSVFEGRFQRIRLEGTYRPNRRKKSVFNQNGYVRTGAYPRVKTLTYQNYCVSERSERVRFEF